MFTHSLLKEYKLLFYKKVSCVRNFPIANQQIENTSVPFNDKLFATFFRLNPGTVFGPFVDYCSSSLKRVICFNAKIDRKEIEINDSKKFADYNELTLDLGSINANYLFNSALITAEQLGLITSTPLNRFIIPEAALPLLPKNTSSCYPLYTKKSDSDTIDYTISTVKAYFQNPSLRFLLKQIVTIYHRFYNVLNPDFLSSYYKTRIVWGFPFAISLIETCLLGSLNTFCSEKAKLTDMYYSGSGKTKLQISTGIIKAIRSKRCDILATDLEAFDTRVKTFFWPLFYALLPFAYYDYKSNEKLYDNMMIYHVFTPYCYKSFKIKHKRQGNCSGTFVTTLFNTFVNLTILNYAVIEKLHGKYPHDYIATVLGDDSLVTCQYYGLTHLKSVYSRFGMVVNEKKSSRVSFDSPVKYLGFTWDPENEPTADLKWCVDHICVSNKFHTDLDISVAEFFTYRGISTMLNIKDGFLKYIDLMGGKDFVLNEILEEYNSGLKPSILLYNSRKQCFEDNPIPVGEILEKGWRMT